MALAMASRILSDHFKLFVRFEEPFEEEREEIVDTEYLEVKAKPGWRENPRVLRDLEPMEAVWTPAQAADEGPDES
jgi:hypothetical protein